VYIPEARSLMCNINTRVSKLIPWSTTLYCPQIWRKFCCQF